MNPASSSADSEVVSELKGWGGGERAQLDSGRGAKIAAGWAGSLLDGLAQDETSH